MIINKIRIQEKNPMTAGSTIYELPICDLALDSSAGANGYFIKVADGLGPPAITAVVEGFDSTGIPILGSNAQARSISLRVELKPGVGQSYSSLRDILYRYMSRSVIVSFMYGAIERARTYGYISAIDNSLFTKQPDIQLVIKCDDGDLFAPAKTSIPLGILNTLSPAIDYATGTAPTGLTLKFNVIATQASFSITNHAKVWHTGSGSVSNVFTVTYPFVNGDSVVISTHPTDKQILLTRSSVVYDLAGYVNARAVWPRLFAGVNAFDWTFASSWMTWTEASYIARYWGV